MRCTKTLKEPAGERSGASNMGRALSLCASMAGDLGTIQPFTRQSETVHDSGCRSIGLARGYRDGDDQHAWVEYRLWRGRALSHDAIQVVLRPKPPTRPISCAHRTCRSSRLRQGYRGCTRTHQSSLRSLGVPSAGRAKGRPGRTRSNSRPLLELSEQVGRLPFPVSGMTTPRDKPSRGSF
jgi:hypothetical protein